MKYIKKIFENNKKAFNILDEFQSTIDIIKQTDIFKFWKTNNNKLTFDLKVEDNGYLSNLDKMSEKCSEISPIVDDINHVCSRLKGDGYDVKILYDNLKIDVLVVTGIYNMLDFSHYGEVYIDRLELKSWLESIGIELLHTNLETYTLPSKKTHYNELKLRLSSDSLVENKEEKIKKVIEYFINLEHDESKIVDEVKSVGNYINIEFVEDLVVYLD